MSSEIAIVGMACRYADCSTHEQLWENVLSQRVAFRQIPPDRLRVEDYVSSDRDAEDRTYCSRAAVIAGYDFSRLRYRVAGETYRSVDLSHWLALDTAAQALDDAGFSDLTMLPRIKTGVIVGNSLTGEISRANAMRLRWPYVKRVVESVLAQETWIGPHLERLLFQIEARYKEPFPRVNNETLAGGLSNTIAGRICNHFDFKGAGYVVDAACASSLLSVITASSLLAAGHLDIALAGAVDLSLDPFELVGFAKLGALAQDSMRVYDEHATGFLPGEGAGFLVLMRREDALADRRRVYATIRGWGMSSDGSGGITRPELEGQSLALARAYQLAGFDIGTVAYFEGHGTGTKVGDTVELEALTRCLQKSASVGQASVIGSVKANIGHTKAAAGIAGMIKAARAVHSQLIPPTTGCYHPHPAFLQGQLRIAPTAEFWPDNRPVRAGVSAMGFGGINTHVVLEGTEPCRRKVYTAKETELSHSFQDAELFVFDGATTSDLKQKVDRVLGYAHSLSQCELTDLSAALSKPGEGLAFRGAVVAASPEELYHRLQSLIGLIKDGIGQRLDLAAGVFLGHNRPGARIGFLFPGQGSLSKSDGGAWRKRFQAFDDLYASQRLSPHADVRRTNVAQPAIALSSVAALRTLEQLGIPGALAIGHSLGELVAMHWAGAFDEDTLLDIAATRGRLMMALPGHHGAMAVVGADHVVVHELLDRDVVIAAFNSRVQTVISGHQDAVASVLSRAESKGIPVLRLPVSHAFHSPFVAPICDEFAAYLDTWKIKPVERPILSTVTGDWLNVDKEPSALLQQQLTLPVKFMQAIEKSRHMVDLFIEVGPGNTLAGVLSTDDVPVISVDACGPSLTGLLKAIGAAFVLGFADNHGFLHRNRFSRPFDLNWSSSFLTNPCELAPVTATITKSEAPSFTDHASSIVQRPVEDESVANPLALLRQLTAEFTELPPSQIRDDHNFLTDLHLNSISVTQLLADAAQRLQVPALIGTDYSTATVGSAAQALVDQRNTRHLSNSHEKLASGVASWVKAFSVNWTARRLTELRTVSESEVGGWRPIGRFQRFRSRLLQLLEHFAPGGGIVTCCRPDDDSLRSFLEVAKAAFGKNRPACLIFLQEVSLASAFAKTIHLESGIKTCVITVPFHHPEMAAWVAAEAQAVRDYAEARYDEAGCRFEPQLELLPLLDGAGSPLTSDDVLLVTGGAKGIAAECAFHLARRSGARLALIGRTPAGSDRELDANLERLRGAGISFCYEVADITDSSETTLIIRKAQAEFGPITAVLHAAGTNTPQLLPAIDRQKFLSTLAPKVAGLRNIVAAIDPEALRLLVTFGSLIARTGLRGEADYALANEWLATEVERWQASHTSCRCLNIEWSVWSGIGMGQRLGRMDLLKRQGITPITPDEGVRWLQRLLSNDISATSVVVTGRFGNPPTLKLAPSDIPFLRFLERTQVHYPGIEIVVDSEVNADEDPYILDHVFDGHPILPAVMGLEAMAQAAQALLGPGPQLAFEHLQLDRAVVIPDRQSVTIRLAALMTSPGVVDVALRSSETNFAVDHFKARCRSVDGDLLAASASELAAEEELDVAPTIDLYGALLFHQGRFRRVRAYRRLSSTECVAEIEEESRMSWFGRNHSQELLLCDPAGRDAAIHAIQACLPHERILPSAVERVLISRSPRADGPLFASAVERRKTGESFVYDVDITDRDGKVVERWEGLTLRRMGTRGPRHWPAAWLRPFFERRLPELFPHSDLKLFIETNGGIRHTSSDTMLSKANSNSHAIYRRSDGKLEAQGPLRSCASHSANLTVVATGLGTLACDVEEVVDRPLWVDLLGAERLTLAEIVSRECHEPISVAGTRIWAAGECLTKAAAPIDSPLQYAGVTNDGWVVLTSGQSKIATIEIGLKELDKPVILAVLGDGKQRLQCELMNTATR